MLSLIKQSGERIALKSGEEFVVFRQRTESLPVMFDSVMTVVNDGYHERYRFALSS